MIDDGFIHLYRSMLTTSFARKPNLVAAWVHCLLLASWKEYDTMIGMTPVHLKPGQFITGRKRFAEETGLSENIVRNAFSHFSNQGMIKVDTSQGQAASIVTIVNWETYQNIGQSYNQGSTKVQPSKNQAITKPSPLYEELQEVVSPIEAKASITPQGGSPLPEQQETTATAAPDTTFSVKTPASPVNDSERPKATIAPPDVQTSNQEPRKRKQRVRSKEAQMIFDAWEYKRSDDKFDEQLDKNIAKLLKEGYTIEELLVCVKRAMPEEANTDPNYRKKASNFFGTKGYFKPYLDENFTEPEPPKVVNAFSSLDRLRIMLEEQGCRMPTRYSDEDIADMCAFEAKLQSEKEVAVG